MLTGERFFMGICRALSLVFELLNFHISNAKNQVDIQAQSMRVSPFVLLDTLYRLVNLK
ncbi:hypothetical protein JCM10914A_22420 [Paenibacillus sp. JCM 10914]